MKLTKRMSLERDASGMCWAPVVEDAVVNLVGEDDKAVLLRHPDDPFEDISRVDRAGRVVRIDHDDAPGPRGNLRFHVLEIGIPVRLLVAYVVNRLSSRKVHRSRPKRVVRGGNEHLVAVVEEGLHGHHDHLAHAVAHVDVLDLDVLDARELALLHDSLASREEPLGVAICLGKPYVERDVADDLVRGVDAESRRIPAVQLDDRIALLLEPLRLLEQGSPDFIADVVHLVRLQDLVHTTSPTSRLPA